MSLFRKPLHFSILKPDMTKASPLQYLLAFQVRHNLLTVVRDL
jgi:hypothetical protein